MSTIEFIEFKMIKFDDHKTKQLGMIIHFKTNETATFDAKNWTLDFS